MPLRSAWTRWPPSSSTGCRTAAPAAWSGSPRPRSATPLALERPQPRRHPGRRRRRRRLAAALEPALGAAAGSIPSSSLWATDPAGFGQVGCIYTAQGFESDLAGVIIGPDLVWRGDRWRTNPTATADTQVRRAANFDLLVRNVYKVLLTRGLIGCVIYSTDLRPERFLPDSEFQARREKSSGRGQYLAFVNWPRCRRPSVCCRGADRHIRWWCGH